MSSSCAREEISSRSGQEDKGMSVLETECVVFTSIPNTLPLEPTKLFHVWCEFPLLPPNLFLLPSSFSYRALRNVPRPPTAVRSQDRSGEVHGA